MEVPQELQDLIYKTECWANESWVNVPEDFNGLKINNMNLYHLMMLDGIESPFLNGGEVTDQDIALFLWIVSKDYCQDEKIQKKFFEKVVKIKVGDATRFIQEYIRKTFAESDTMGKGDKGQVYFISYYVDLFAREYSWSYKDIINLPLRIGFQLITAVNERSAKLSGENYNRITSLDNEINRYILKSKSSNGI